MVPGVRDGRGKGDAGLSILGLGPFLAVFSPRLVTTPQVPTMDTIPYRQARRDNSLSLLTTSIEVMNLAEELSSIAPAKALFGSVSVLLIMIRVRCLLFSDDTVQVHNVTRTLRPIKSTMSTSD